MMGIIVISPNPPWGLWLCLMGLHEYGKEDAIVVRCTNWRNNLKTLLSLGDEDSTKSIVVADELVTQV